MAPCSGPGYARGPDPQAGAEAPLFTVLFNCLWPSHERMEISVVLALPAKRAEVAALLHALWEGLETRMGKTFPATVKVCVLSPKATLSSPPLGCLRKGYEPEGEEGEGAEEEELRIDMPPAPDELAASFRDGFGRVFTGPRRAEVKLDEVKGEYAMTYPYVDYVTNDWAARPSYVSVVLPFFLFAWNFYPPKTESKAMRFTGAWRDKTLLEVRLTDLKTFLAMDPWGGRERLAAAKIPLGVGAFRTAEQDARVHKELAAALSKLPPGSVVVDPSIR
jgi:hypothetical protein